MIDSYSNPFSGSNAKMLDDKAILNYWCDPFNYKLFTDISEKDIFRSPMNIVFMGGRNTGKTMFLRYWSFQVQLQIARLKKIEKNLNLIDHFKNLGGIGVYIRVDGPLLRSFSGYGFKEENWSAIFTHYFELILAQNYLEIINILKNNGELDEVEIEKNVVPQISKLLQIKGKMDLSNLILQIENLIVEVNEYRGKVPFYNTNFTPSVGFGSQSLSFGIPKILMNCINAFKSDFRIIILLDEYENYLEPQQRIINTLLRFTDSSLMFRIGMRLKGLRTYQMMTNDDFIKEGREYQKVVLEELSLKAKGYNEFLKEIARKRLDNVKVFKRK